MKSLPWILVIVLILVPGHIRNFTGWSISLTLAALAGFGVGICLSKYRKDIFFLLSATISYLIIPLWTFIDSKEFWYPIIMPAYMTIEFFGIIAGYLLHIRFYKTSSIFFLFTTAIVVYSIVKMDMFIFKTSIDQTDIEYCRNKKIVGETFWDLENNRILYTDTLFNKKVVVLDFWFIRCPNCLVKLAEGYDSLYKRYKGNENILFYSVVKGDIDAKEQVREFLKNKKFDCPVLYDVDGQFANKYKIASEGLPVEIRIDKNGIIRQTIGGYYSAAMMDYLNESENYLNSLINE